MLPGSQEITKRQVHKVCGLPTSGNQGSPHKAQNQGHRLWAAGLFPGVDQSPKVTALTWVWKSNSGSTNQNRAVFFSLRPKASKKKKCYSRADSFSSGSVCSLWLFAHNHPFPNAPPLSTLKKKKKKSDLFPLPLLSLGRPGNWRKFKAN